MEGKKKRGMCLNRRIPLFSCILPSSGGDGGVGFLFPFDGRRRLRRDVVANAVDTLHLVDDVVRDLGKELVGQVSPVGSHGIGAGDGAECHGILVGAFVAHHAYAPHIGEQDGACLPYLVVESPVAEALDEDVVGILQDAHLLGCDGAEDAHGQSRSGEGMASDEVFGDAELSAHAAHLVLEEPLQRLAQLEVHLLGQSAHVVMALDDLARDVEALDAVGVDGALGKPVALTI